MNFTDIRVKFNNFFRKNKNKIFIGVFIITIIIAVNIFLGKIQDARPPSVSYEPHNPIVSGDEIKSETTQTTIEEMISTYMNFCNQKNYDEAYNYLTEECKEYKFNNKIDTFKKYIDYIFDGSKIYSIQDYSNKDNIYIYKVTISEDILATGKNTDKSDEIYEEMIVITKNNDNYQLAVSGFIKQEEVENVSEDENMRIKIIQKITFYDKIIYKFEIKNKTDYDIILERDKEENCIGISLDGDTREQYIDNYSNTEKVIFAGKTKEIEVTFPKYFDESKKETAIILNKIRLIENYSGDNNLWEQELNNAISKYSVQIKL